MRGNRRTSMRASMMEKNAKRVPPKLRESTVTRTPPEKKDKNPGFHSALEDEIPKAEITGKGEDGARKIIVENPDMNAATLLNTLKASGYKIIPPPSSQETDSSSSFPQVLPAKESLKFRTFSLKETSKSDDGIGPTVFEAVLLQEGLGNLADAFYYTREALESGIQVFEGKKIYVDHPKTSDAETERPERSVRDILGYYQDVRVAEAKDGRLNLVADVRTMDEKDYSWARGLMRQAVEYGKKYPDKDFVGLSINSNGEADVRSLSDFMRETKIPDSALPKLHEAVEEGVDEIRVVTKITDAVSCDLVTEAGAGGKVLQLIEGDHMNPKQKLEKELKESKAALKKLQESKAGKKKLIEAKAKVNAINTKLSKLKESEQDGDHDDGDQDAAMMKKMVDKYMDEAGNKDEMDEAETQAHREKYEGYAKQAYQRAKEMGYEGEGAMTMAAYGADLLKDMAESTEANPDDEDPAKKETDKDDEDHEESTETDKDDEDHEESTETETKESSKENLRLRGRVAFLESKNKIREMNDHLDTVLRESKLPRAVTNRFRESVFTEGKDGKKFLNAKSVKDIDQKWKLFSEGFSVGGKADGGIFVNVEKSVPSSNAGKMDLSDCVDEE